MLSVFVLFIVKRRALCRRNLRQSQCNDVLFHTYNALNGAVVPRARKVFKRYDKKKVEVDGFDLFNPSILIQTDFAHRVLNLLYLCSVAQPHRHESGRQTNRNGSIVVSLSPLIFFEYGEKRKPYYLYQNKVL